MTVSNRFYQDVGQNNSEAESKFKISLSYESCVAFLKNSSCFIFHKRSRFRRMMASLVLGRIRTPCFKTVDDLIDFYTQRLNDETDEVLQKQHEDEGDKDDSDDSGIDLEFMHETDDNAKFLNDVNSSAYIEEIRRVQENK